MNSLSPSIVQFTPQLETVFEFMDVKKILSGPREDSKQNLYVCSQSGEIIKFNEKGEYSIILSLTGQPNCLAFDIHEDAESNNSSQKLGNKDEVIDNYFFTDIANSIIYYKKKENDKPEVLVRDYDGIPLKGPTSLSYNPEDNSIIFCDGGYFESTSLSTPTGSVYHVDLTEQTKTPILDKCLAYPSDIFYDGILGIGYIAETFSNRILRITENPQGTFHTSVFHVFDGRVGPTSLASDDLGNIYISRFEYQRYNKDGQPTVDGLISVLNKDGYLIGEIEVPKMSEITGMYIPRRVYDESKDMENLPKVDTFLYFTEKNFNGVKKIKLNNFISEIEKS